MAATVIRPRIMEPFSPQDLQALQAELDRAPFTLAELVTVVRRYPRTIKRLAAQGE